MFPKEYKNSMIIAEKGSWNRDPKQGDNVIRVTLDAKGKATRNEFVEGFLENERGDPPMWGRPIDILHEGRLDPVLRRLQRHPLPRELRQEGAMSSACAARAARRAGREIWTAVLRRTAGFGFAVLVSAAHAGLEEGRAKAEICAACHGMATLDAQQIAKAQAVTEKNNCVACHRPSMVVQQHIPRLAGQHKAYLLAQIKAFKASTRADLDGTMISTAQGPAVDELERVADYLATLDAP